MKRPPVWLILLLPLLWVTLAVRVWHLQFLSLWWDEGVSIYLAGAGWRALTIAKDFGVDLHPPGYHLLLAGWRELLGPSVFSDRLLSTFAGVLTIPLAYGFSRRLAELAETPPVPVGLPHRPGWAAEAVGLTAAVLALASPIDVYYSQETRMYALLPPLGVLSLWATLTVLQRGTGRAWLGWILANAAGLYVYYYLGFLTAAESLTLLAFGQAFATALAPTVVQTVEGDATRTGEGHFGRADASVDGRSGVGAAAGGRPRTGSIDRGGPDPAARAPLAGAVFSVGAPAADGSPPRGTREPSSDADLVVVPSAESRPPTGPGYVRADGGAAAEPLPVDHPHLPFAAGNVRLSPPWLVRWLGAQVAVIALYLPWLALMAIRMRGLPLQPPAGTAVRLSALGYLGENWQDFTAGFTLPPHGTSVMLLWGAVALLGTLALGRRRPALALLLVLGFGLPILEAGLVLIVRPFYFPRFILFVLPPLWTLVALGLVAAARWRLRPLGPVFLPLAVVVGGLLLAGSGWTWYFERTHPRVGYAPDDYRTVFPSLAAAAQSGDPVLCGYPWQVGYVDAYLWSSHLRPTYLPGPTRPALVGGILSATGRAWTYMYSPDHQFRGDQIEQALAARGATLFVDQYGDARVQLFATAADRPSGPVAPATRPVATLGSQIALLDSTGPGPGPWHPGDRITFTLRWEALSAPDASYTVFLHLLGPNGKVQAQHDSPPLGGDFPTDHWVAGEQLVDRYTIAIPPRAPAGTYQVETGLYLPRTGQRLVVGPQPNHDNRVLLGTITVVR